MAQVKLAHYRDQGINFAIFDADAVVKTTQARSDLLCELTATARQAGLRIDKSVLAYTEFGRLTFFGTPDLVSYLAVGQGVPGWTHTIVV